MASAKQGAFVGRAEAVLSRDRLERYSATATEPRWEHLARYEWNVAICEAFYPLLHHLEIVLRNRLDRVGEAAYPFRRVNHIRSWLDAIPSALHTYGVNDVFRAKQKLFGIDRATGALLAPTRQFTAGDLIASLDFGFWTGLFNRDYLFQSSRDKRLWPHGLKDVFPYAPTVPTLKSISGRLNQLRHLRNRIFHHEPIWRRPDLAADRDNILELVDWMSPEIGRVLRATERLSDVISDDFRRRLRIRIYRESRR
ncbi:MAG TPA: hypothetical protein VEX86_09845 [Longimicrobium sp.]|nr:hypothetical protein [Longimicrobium sp.]